MPLINVTKRSGETLSIEASAGSSLKDALMDGGVEEINAVTSCGGCCSCGTCHVFIDPADWPRLPGMQSQEDDLLYAQDQRRATSRLACQISVTDQLDELKVTVAPEW
jgi:2Fe-2S ferredoxin